MKPRLLDLFCGAGGAGEGYSRAGFDVVGVDIEPQPNYPFEFVQGDALEYLDAAFAGDWWKPHHSYAVAVHASPPCQAFTAYRRTGRVGAALDLIFETQERLYAFGLPYVIENVPTAPLSDPIMLCGSAFGLDVRRHRLFETSFPLMSPGCAHGQQLARFPAATNRGKDSRKTVEVGVWRIPLDVQQRAMGIDWMNLEELSEAVPPAYTEHIGGYLMAEVQVRREVAA